MYIAEAELVECVNKVNRSILFGPTGRFNLYQEILSFELFSGPGRIRTCNQAAMVGQLHRSALGFRNCCRDGATRNPKAYYYLIVHIP